MKPNTPLLALSSLAVLAGQPLTAALLAYEGFASSAYNVGANPNSPDFSTDSLAGQGSSSGSGFTGNWFAGATLNSRSKIYWDFEGGSTPAADNYLRADGGQATPRGLPPATGQASYLANSGTANQITVQRNFTVGASAPNTLYLSTLITFDGSAGITLGLQSSNVTVSAGSDARPFQFGITQAGNLYARGTASSANPDYTESATYATGTYLFVARFTNGGTTNDSIEIWVNPGSTLGTADLTFNQASAGNNTNFYVGSTSSYAVEGLVLDFRSSGATAGTTSVDEIRIGTAYLDVIPEPSTALLGALGALCLLRRKR